MEDHFEIHLSSCFGKAVAGVHLLQKQTRTGSHMQGKREMNLSKEIKADRKNEENETGEVVAKLGDSPFNMMGYADEDEFGKKAKCTEFGNDPPNFVRQELDACVMDAHSDFLSTNGANKLETLLQRFGGIIKIRLETVGPAKVTLKIDLNPGSKLTKVEVRKFLVEQHIFLRSHIQQLVHFELLIPNLASEWKAAPHLVPKKTS